MKNHASILDANLDSTATIQDFLVNRLFELTPFVVGSRTKNNVTVSNIFNRYWDTRIDVIDCINFRKLETEKD